MSILRLALGVMWGLAAPVFAQLLPAPTGRYTTGRVSYASVDRARAEELTPDPNDRREFAFHIWYPCMPATGTLDTYLPDLPKWRARLGDQAMQTALDGALDAAAKTRGLARVGGEALYKGRFPLLVFFPAQGMNSLVYTALLSELTSYGYIVVALDPTYEVFATTLREGRVAGPVAGPPDDRPKVWAADARLVLDKLPANSQLKRSIDWQRVGALGHGAGGRAASVLCQSDPRVQVCLSLDDSMAVSATSKIFGFLRPPPPRPVEALPPSAVEIVITGIRHNNFFDVPLLNQAPSSETAITAIRAYTVAFFDKFLRRKLGTILNTPPPPNVHVTQRPSDTSDPPN